MMKRLALCLVFVATCQVASADGFFFYGSPFGGGVGRSYSFNSQFYHYSAPTYSAPSYSYGYQRVPIFVRRAVPVAPRVRTVTVVRRVVKLKSAPVSPPCACPPVID